MTYTYRPMTIADYDALYALWSATPGVGLSGADGYEAIERYLSRNPDMSLVCLCGEALAGAILCGNDGRRAYIHHTAVAPGHRRQGVAAQLVARALEIQRRQGIDKCHLFIFHENEQGMAFWRSMGFTAREDIGVWSRTV